MKVQSQTNQTAQLFSDPSALRKEFHKARAQYELSLRRFILNHVDNCPCCFDGFFDDSKNRVKTIAFYDDFEPDVLDVLEEMYQQLLPKNDRKVEH